MEATPNKIEVFVRVVGLFFSKKVTVGIKPGKTIADLSVQDIMEAAAAQYPISDPVKYPNGIDYRISSEGGPGDPRPSVLAISTRFDGKYEEFIEGIEVKDPKGLTIGKRKRDAGIYTLQELVLDPIVVAWQYYVIGKNGKNKTKTKPGKGFTFFSQPIIKNNGIAIESGDTLVWRMVAIVRRPNGEEPSTQYVEKIPS